MKPTDNSERLIERSTVPAPPDLAQRADSTEYCPDEDDLAWARATEQESYRAWGDD